MIELEQEKQAFEERTHNLEEEINELKRDN